MYRKERLSKLIRAVAIETAIMAFKQSTEIDESLVFLPTRKCVISDRLVVHTHTQWRRPSHGSSMGQGGPMWHGLGTCPGVTFLCSDGYNKQRDGHGYKQFVGALVAARCIIIAPSSLLLRQRPSTSWLLSWSSPRKCWTLSSSKLKSRRNLAAMSMVVCSTFISLFEIVFWHFLLLLIFFFFF